MYSAKMACDNKKVLRKRRVLFVNWKEVNGASVKKRVLRLCSNENGEYICPVSDCLHVAFKTQRGLRKHINGVHAWYLYFDQQPCINRNLAKEQPQNTLKVSTHRFPAFTLETGIGKEFVEWLSTACGGGRTVKEAKNIGKRAMKFLMASFDEQTLASVLKEDYIDCCLGSPTILMDFLRVITEDWGLQAGSALAYVKAIGDLLDYRKASGVSDHSLRAFTVTEVYIRRGKENLAKRKKVEYGRNLDLETLISRNSWATLDDMEKVIPYHTPKYEYVVKKCISGEQTPTVSELSFATRFIVTFLFLRVKCTRPMTFQYLTLPMVNVAKSNGGYVDQTQFKTSDKYVFDTLILTEDVLKILDSYITSVRPLMVPRCEYLLVTCNGTQYTAFGTAMSLLVHQAIGKSVNPTRYRQIIESESSLKLNVNERDVVSKDQKHSSQVAKRIYQKRLSREVAAEARTCLQKLTGSEKEAHTQTLATSLARHTDVPCSSRDFQPIATTATVEVRNGTDTSCDEMDDAHEIIDVPMDEETEPVAVQYTAPTEVHTATSLNTSSNQKESDVSNTSNKSPSTKAQVSLPLAEVEVKKEEVEKEMADGLRLKRFSSDEDAALKEGVVKYGYGMWRQILKDATLNFHPLRTRDSLRMRAKTLKLNTRINNKGKK